MFDPEVLKTRTHRQCHFSSRRNEQISRANGIEIIQGLFRAGEVAVAATDEQLHRSFQVLRTY
jgi:hypothetical protein